MSKEFQCVCFQYFNEPHQACACSHFVDFTFGQSINLTPRGSGTFLTALVINHTILIFSILNFNIIQNWLLTIANTMIKYQLIQTN